MGGGFKSDKSKYYSQDAEIPLEYVLASGDLIVTMTDLNKDGGTLGFPAKVPFNGELQYLHNQRIGKVTLTSEIVNQNFIYHLLCTKSYRRHILSTASGTTVNHTSPSRILSFKCAMPTLKEQQCIAEILSTTDEHMEKLDKTIEDYQVLKKGIKKKLLTEGIGHSEFKDTEVGRIPKVWEVKELKDIADIISGGTPKTNVDEYWLNGNVLWATPTVTDEIINTTYKALAERYCQDVLNTRWNTCKMIFAYAEDKEYIKKSPFRSFKKKPKSQKNNPEEDEKYKAFTDSEMERIISAAQNDTTLYPVLTLLRSTGMRPGELRALMWKNFSSDDKTIKIVSAVTRKYEKVDDIAEKANSEEVISKTKTKYSNRTIYLSAEAIAALVDWRTYLDNCKNKKMKESKYIFPNKAGEFTKETALRSKLQRFKIKYNIQDTGLHQYKFRHSMCTKLILDNHPIPVIRRIMGDNTIDVIMGIYTHIHGDDVKKASEKFFEELNNTYEANKQREQQLQE